MSKKSPVRLDVADIDAAIHVLQQNDIKAELIGAVAKLRDQHAGVQRSIKDAIFTNLFSRQKYLLLLYKCLHPEDQDVTEEDLQIMTLENVIANGMRNDLGFTARGRLVILMEAQSTWSLNIVLRQLLYLADTWQEWLHQTGQIIYRTTKVQIPQPELYAIFPGQTGPDTISLADQFLDGDSSVVDCTVKCIYDRPKKEILGQYIRCSEICDEEIAKWDRNYTKAAVEIRRRCLEEGILTDFLEEIGGELQRMVEYRTEAEIQEQIIAQDGAAREARGEARGEIRGEAKGRTAVAVNLLQAGLLTPEQISAATAIPLAEIEAMASGKEAAALT